MPPIETRSYAFAKKVLFPYGGEPTLAAHGEQLSRIAELFRAYVSDIPHAPEIKPTQAYCYRCGLPLEDVVHVWAAPVFVNPPKWTPEKPTKSGWYWYRDNVLRRKIVVEIAPTEESGELAIFFNGKHQLLSMLFFLGGLWAGPLTPPEEEK